MVLWWCCLSSSRGGRGSALREALYTGPLCFQAVFAKSGERERWVRWRKKSCFAVLSCSVFPGRVVVVVTLVSNESV